MAIQTLNIAKHLAALRKIGNLGPKLEDGFLRASWSDEETAAMEYIKSYAEGHGLKGRYDAIGNLFISTATDYEEVIQIGSHLDTVPRGGLYDGGAGIIAGLEAILDVAPEIQNSKIALELVIWRGEESGTFAVVYKGSKAAFGLAPADMLERSFSGKTLRQAITEQGYNPQVIEKSIPTVTQREVDKIKAHLELHIEQSTKLEIDRCDIGIVTSIRGPKRYFVTIKGESAHSGATPMGTKYRHDAHLALGYILVRLNELLNSHISEGADLVQSVGVINSDRDFNTQHPAIYESAVTKVAELAYFTLDIRSNKNQTLESYADKALSVIRETASEFATSVTIKEVGSSKALEQMDNELQDLIEQSCNELGYSSQRMPSGAGHDVTIVSAQKKSNGQHIATALIFIPCQAGISHNPLEYATDEQITKGAQVLSKTLQKLIR